MSILQFLVLYTACGYVSVLVQGLAARRILGAGLQPRQIHAGNLLLWPIPTIGALHAIGKYPKVAVK